MRKQEVEDREKQEEGGETKGSRGPEQVNEEGGEEKDGKTPQSRGGKQRALLTSPPPAAHPSCIHLDGDRRSWCQTTG